MDKALWKSTKSKRQSKKSTSTPTACSPTTLQWRCATPLKRWTRKKLARVTWHWLCSIIIGETKTLNTFKKLFTELKSLTAISWPAVCAR